ncbi:MAG: NAD(P)/FAD-dependent oxidoreductase [Gemmatimonadota bacterium]
MSGSYDTIVIGAGHNGLVAAAYLARAGRSVLVLERREVVGGAAATEEVFPGFRVDTGAHRVGGLSARVVDDLDLARHGLELLDADPTVFVPVLEGTPLTLWRDARRTSEAIRPISPADADAWVPFTELIGKAAGFLQAAWTTTPPDVTGGDIGDLVASARLGLKLRRLGKKDMVEVMRVLPMSVYELLGDWFESDVVKGALAASAVAGLCQGPMGAGTVYTLLHHHVGAQPGVIRPMRRVRGGIGRLSEALVAACTEAGAEVRTGAAVERIVVEGGRAVGALVDRAEIRAARIVSSLDPRRTFFDLMEPSEMGTEFARKVSNIRYRGVCAKAHFALGGLPNFTCLPGEGPHLNGVISIGPSLEYVERAFDAAKYGRVSARPCLEVSIPSLADPTVAPAGKHLMSVVLQYAPYHLREGAWDDTARARLGDLALATLEEYAPGLSSLVEARHVMTPLDMERTFGLSEGNVNHGEMTLDQLLFMRPVPGASRYRAPIAGLYLCGAGTHPGGGVTGVPGFNAAREILKG